ncbi:MAG: isocitrate/isopropylmalate family dehydrogenase, partial [Acidimicrobiales bacterium]
ASGNLNPARTGPSLFEPVHGAAHDIVGTGRANPTAAVRSGAMLLRFVGETDAASRMEKALEVPPPAGLSTSEIGDYFAERV